MMRLFTVAALLTMTACQDEVRTADNNVATLQSELAAAAQTVIIGTKDGHKFYADHVPVPHGRATILLFHRGGSSVYEFSDIAPRLNEQGYSTLAVDLRTGGTLFGPNRTVDKYGKADPDPLNALPDMEAAINWARLQGQPVILLGSGSSASLALRLAADHPELVAGVAAFSPGDDVCKMHHVRDAAAKVNAPVFITYGAKEGPDAAQAIFKALPGSNKTLYDPVAGGASGASALSKDRNPSGEAQSWRALDRFLEGVV